VCEGVVHVSVATSVVWFLDEIPNREDRVVFIRAAFLNKEINFKKTAIFKKQKTQSTADYSTGTFQNRTLGSD
jgi:hypothetical protein